MGLTVLSLFDGISCGQLALQNLGIKVDNYYASEIDKYAIAITQKNFPNTIQLGDVKNLDTSKLPPIDIMFGGFPCQSYSIAGKQRGFDDDRGSLFFDLLRIKAEVRPKYFLFENVKMKRATKETIDNYLGVEGVLLNSALFSPQFRSRYYWTNLEIQPVTEPSRATIADILDYDAEYQDLSDYTFQVNVRFAKGVKYIGGLLSPRETLWRGKFRVNQRVVDMSGKYPTVNAVRSYPYISTGRGGRKPTVLELERLQGLPDNYTECVSNTQRKKAIGNGWQVDTIAHILKGIQDL